MSDKSKPENLTDVDLDASSGGGSHDRWIDLAMVSQGISRPKNTAEAPGDLQAGEQGKPASGHYTQVVWAKT
ncbi:MAG: hypothetical protein AAGH74_01370 [Pseudomonadota bacterium]